LIPLIYHPIYSALPLPDGHRYPIRKYELRYEAVAERYSNSSLFRFVEPQALSVSDIHQPDLVIFDAGVDIHQDDELGFLNVTLDGIRERDRWMLVTCQKRNIPIACVIGGGYRRNHADLVPIQMSLIEAAAKLKEAT
jgi:acetoin utilization deacetylase AcuC-like enzyme